MLAADVVIAPTIQSLSHTAARKAASEAGVRIATMPGVTEEMLARVMSADIDELRRRGEAICALLDGGAEARITCANGSDLRLGLETRHVDRRRRRTQRPAAPSATCPAARASSRRSRGPGRGRSSSTARSPASAWSRSRSTLTVRDGHLTDADRRRRRARCSSCSPRTGEDGTNVAELGIGTNEEAILTGNILEDEKILGTAHVAFGASAAIGGTVQVPVHLDCVVLEPTVEIDGEAIVRDGELLV